MLVRMDPAQNQTSILSIPRDLYVHFTYRGQSYSGKFNSTYSIGGPDLVKRVALQTLPGIKINHVIDFNFASFLGLVDAIGCVYVNVGQRYLNNSDPTYQFIDIQPGYQRLCGNKALSYVRYRHTDSDFVRVARQQDFIRQAKEQLGVWGFVSNYDQLAKAFGRAVWTDIRSTTDVAQLLELAFFSLSRPIRQVPFEVDNTALAVGNQLAVGSSPHLIRQSLDNFLYVHPAAPVPAAPTHASAARSHHRRTSTAAAGTNGSLRGPDHGEQPGAGAHRQRPVPRLSPERRDGTGGSRRLPRLPHWRRAAPPPLWLPDRRSSTAGGYYGIEGMNWTTPPLFANPNATETIGGRTYLFVTDGRHYHDIGWRQGGVLYWVSNTLREDLTNTQMLDIADQRMRWPEGHGWDRPTSEAARARGPAR